MTVGKIVKILAGFPPNSRRDKMATPYWQAQYRIVPKIRPSVPLPNDQSLYMDLDQKMSEVFFGDDQCVYADLQVWPWYSPVYGAFGLGTWMKNPQRSPPVGIPSCK